MAVTNRMVNNTKAQEAKITDSVTERKCIDLVNAWKNQRSSKGHINMTALPSSEDIRTWRKIYHRRKVARCACVGNGTIQTPT